MIIFFTCPVSSSRPSPCAVDAGIVADAGQVLHARIAHRVDQLVGNADQPEAAAHHHHAVVQHALERRLGILVDLVRHPRPSLPPSYGKSPYLQVRIRIMTDRRSALGEASLRQQQELPRQRAVGVAQFMGDGEMIGAGHRDQRPRQMLGGAFGMEVPAVGDQRRQLGRAVGDGQRLFHHRQAQRRERLDLARR